MQISAAEIQARKAVDEQQGKLDQLRKAYEERRDSFAKEFFALPIIDAFGRPLKVEQIWLPKLTINNNFRDVARFDRCTTCHQGLDKTLPGSAVVPAYPIAEEQTLTMATPAEAPAEPQDAQAVERELGWSGPEQKLGNWFGMHLADRGVLAKNDVTVSVVQPQSPAAKAGLMAGDVITEINGELMLDKSFAYRYLVDSVRWGEPIRLKVRERHKSLRFASAARSVCRIA